MTRTVTEEQAENEERRIEQDNEYGSRYYHWIKRVEAAREEWENRDD